MPRAACLALFVALGPGLVATPALAADDIYVLNKAIAKVSILDAASGEVRKVIDVGDGPHEAVTTPDQRHVVVGNYGSREGGQTLSVIDTRTHEVTRTIDLTPYHRPHGLVFLPDGKHLLVTAETERKLLVVEFASGKVEAAIDTAQGGSHMVALAPDGKRAYVANIGSGSMTAMDLQKRTRLANVPCGRGAEGIMVHPTRPEVWVTCRAEDAVAIVDTKELKVIEKLPCKSFPIRVAFTRDGANALVTCPSTGDIAIFDAEKRTETRRIVMKKKQLSEEEKGNRLFRGRFGDSPLPIGILMAPRGDRAYVANAHGDNLAEIDLGTWTVLRYIAAGQEPDGLAWCRRTEVY